MRRAKVLSYIGAKATNESVSLLQNAYLDFEIRCQLEQCYQCKQDLAPKYFLPGKMLTNFIGPWLIQNLLPHHLQLSGVAGGHNLWENAKLESHQFRRRFVAQITKLSLL
jgi:hypothetical protein